MDPQLSAQDVLRCASCESPSPPLHCDFCHIYLCKKCVGDHLLDLSKKHQVVPLQERESTPKYSSCTKQPNEQCKHFCEKCKIPVCFSCISKGNHLGHNLIDIMNIFQRKKDDLRKDLKELEELILPKFEDYASYIQVQKTELFENSNKLTTSVQKQGEYLQREIDNIIKN